MVKSPITFTAASCEYVDNMSKTNISDDDKLLFASFFSGSSPITDDCI